jgi:23S rRNA pseudouridine1911/1915/1917 synthase
MKNSSEETGQERIGDWVLEKNNQFIAFSKPAGIPVQADKTEDKSLQQLAEIYAKSTLHLVNRIDRPVSGAVLFAKNTKAMTELTEQFRNRQINKTYLAIVSAAPPAASDQLTHWIEKDGRTNRSSVSDTKTSENAQEAILEYQLLGSSERYFLLEVRLISGRHHQVRAQLAKIGCPIKGDVKYGARRGNKDRSIHLHAWKLSFLHPVTKERINLEAPLPTESLWDAMKVFLHEEL